MNLKVTSIARISVLTLGMVCILISCGGGGGGTATAPVPTLSPTPAPTPPVTPSPLAVPSTSTAKSLALIVGTADTPGSKDGALLDASFDAPRALSVTADGTVYVADGCTSSLWSGHALYRKISPSGQVTTFAGTTSYLNVGHPTTNSAYSVSTTDQFNGDCTLGIAALPDGNLYASGASAVVEKITPSGQISTVVGSWGQPGAADGSGTTARLRGGKSLWIRKAMCTLLTRSIMSFGKLTQQAN